MLYFLLPNIHISIYENINCIIKDDPPSSHISNSLSYYLYDIKNKIDTCGKDWDIYKKYTNPYEYVNTIVPNKMKCVAKYKSLSRSYFKMIEILTIFNLRTPNNENVFTKKESNSISAINSFHLAEGPGGFIEALVNSRMNPYDKYVGMTILDDTNDYNIPAWKKSNSFLKSNPNVEIETGSDGTGNILSMDNFIYCCNKYGSSMDIITADGGFDFSQDFNKQEINITQLLFGQICYAICLQKKNGHFILKIFDCFMEHTIDLLYILSAFYKKVYITKPQTSRNANSEKYIVCKNFLFSSNFDFFDKIKNAFKIMLEMKPDKYVHRFLTCPISNLFMNRLEEYNSIFGQQQIENIHQTIMLIDTRHKNDNKIDNLIKNNIQKCTFWCMKYNIQYNMLNNSITSYENKMAYNENNSEINE
jgi:23S rRNA U2552 (ribose-2'-O)-methylase RlmE/FtsJ